MITQKKQAIALVAVISDFVSSDTLNYLRYYQRALAQVGNGIAKAEASDFADLVRSRADTDPLIAEIDKIEPSHEDRRQLEGVSQLLMS